MNYAGVFSGIGGFDIPAEWMGWNNVFHCEINKFGRSVLNKKWPNAISYENIETTDFRKHRGTINVFSGGFPCQDASEANQTSEGQQGLRGKRTGLLFEMCRAIREIRPEIVVAENVANILKINGGRDFTTILTELSSMGYNAEWRICYASEVGSPHRRARMYLVAYPGSFRLQKGQTFFQNVHQEASPIPWHTAGTSVQIVRGDSWLPEPPTICVDDGVPSGMDGYSSGQFRMESIKAYGNAVIPQLAYCIFKGISQIFYNETK